LIHYQYTKIIAQRAFGAADGKEVKKQSFISRQKIYSLELRFSNQHTESVLARHKRLAKVVKIGKDNVCKEFFLKGK